MKSSSCTPGESLSAPPPGNFSSGPQILTRAGCLCPCRTRHRRQTVEICIRYPDCRPTPRTFRRGAHLPRGATRFRTSAAVNFRQWFRSLPNVYPCVTLPKRSMKNPLISIRDLKVHFDLGGGTLWDKVTGG